MKRILSLILSVLLASSAFTACNSTPAGETETNDATETIVRETEVLEPTHTDLITENGEARAHIVVAEDADALLSYGAEELVYHINKVSGATLSVTKEATSDGIAIVIATPETHPQLETLFPEDIAWLSTLEENGKEYGSDGFAVRRLENTVYIFGMTPRGALNGVYDFIEENMDVMWIRSDDETGLIYDEMPTITTKKVDYREKSPFELRGWTLCGAQSVDDITITQILMSRNKMNAQLWWENESVGITNYHLTHNVKSWILTSPTYDPSVTEYWNTDDEGNPLSPEKSPQPNYWSDLTADCVAESILAYLRQNGNAKSVGVGVEDAMTCINLPESGEPFEYAPGQFVNPGDTAYLSTVFFTFLNKVAAKIKVEFPEVKVNTYAYFFTESVPLCPLEENITICIAPILEDMTSPVNDPDNSYNVLVYNLMESWKDLTNDIVIYNYYGCSPALSEYERPIWDRIQADLRYYVECGFDGLLPEGLVDADSPSAWAGNPPCSQSWAINMMTYWIYGKLSWNPEEDVEALIVKFCDKVYGAASEKMQEYYRLLKQGYTEAESAKDYLWNFKHPANYYFDVFVYQIDLEDEMVTVLREAYEAADSDMVRERIRPIKESYEAAFPEI